GAAPRELGVAHEKELRGRGVTYCATCDGRMYKDKTVVVVGGGNTAAADALFLAKLCKKVYLVHRRDSLRATRLYIDALQKMKNVEFVWNSQIAEFLYDAKVQGVVVKNVQTGETRRIEAEGIFVAVGRVPNTAMFQGQLELDDAGYIVADESTRTSLPGVYAVGDVRTKVLRQIVTAAADGAVASHYIEEYLA
ncbi:MAG: FAD-dependent oxidoreductase, partial [Pygmaiobacter massiliensis]|nr:FAD-dependent oxidoreductase [Pygmaiobacter massiliensis]